MCCVARLEECASALLLVGERGGGEGGVHWPGVLAWGVFWVE
jgi:hypothetical protein